MQWTEKRKKNNFRVFRESTVTSVNWHELLALGGRKRGNDAVTPLLAQQREVVQIIMCAGFLAFVRFSYTAIYVGCKQHIQRL